MESPEINPPTHIYSQMNFDRETNVIQWGEENILHKYYLIDWISIFKKQICRPIPHTTHKDVKYKAAIRKHRQMCLRPWNRQRFLGKHVKGMNSQGNIDTLKFHQHVKLLIKI